MSEIRVALDGPSGAGKSTIAKRVAALAHLVYVDTGALYRTVGLYMLEHGISELDGDSIVAALPSVKIRLAYEDGVQKVYLGGEDVGDKIRTEKASVYASAVSKIPEVRQFLLGMQSKLADEGGVIMDGRDIGTVIMPDAEVKVFMTASDRVRAERRYNEQRAKGLDVDFDGILEAIRARDKQDAERDTAPMKPADDAVIFSNDNMNIDESANYILSLIEKAREKTNDNGEDKK